MKRRTLSLLLALALCLGLSLPALAAEDALPAVGTKLHGFRVTDRDTLDVLDCPTVTLEHVKSGATVYYVAADDPNRTFDITFRTPAMDDKGIPHIFEHITISGSEKYPNHNLFFPLANQTYNTFVNAVTSSIWTTFPVSSLSEDQLMVLMDFYLDGVFHPMVYTEPRLFEREAWRYSLQSADAPITITGTVYNELKGAMDINRAASYNIGRTLFPGTIIGNNSGGDPAAIPTLTYQELLDFHDTYYRPSNALIVLYGDLDLARFLKAMDEGYLSQYDKDQVTVDNGAMAPLTAPVTGRFEYPAEAGTPTDRAAVIGYGIAANGADREEQMILNVVSDLAVQDGSPVQTAVAQALPGAALSAHVDLDYAQPYIVFEAKGVDESDAPAFQAAVDQGLAAMAKHVDGDMVRAVVSETQLGLRFISESGSKGPSLAQSVASRWAADGSLDYYNAFGDALEEMSAKADKGHIEPIIAKYLVGNRHSALSVTVPVPGLKEEQDAALAQSLADKKAAMTAGEIDAMVRNTNDFAAWSAQEAPKEMVEALKAVSVADLPEELVDYPITDETVDGVRYLTAGAQVTGLNATGIMLSLEGVPTEDLHWVSLYASLLGKLGTSGYSAAELSTLSGRYLGSFYAGVSTVPTGKTSADPYLMAQWIGMDEDYQTSLALMDEVLFHTDFSDTAALQGLIAQAALAQRDGLNEWPTSIQGRRAMARTAPDKYLAYDYATGLPYLAFLDEVSKLAETDPAQVSAKLQAMGQTLYNRMDAVCLLGGGAEALPACERGLRAFWDKVPLRETVPADRSDLPLPGKHEGVVVSAAVQYNQVAAPLSDVGLADSGKLGVLATLLSDRYLTPQLRQILGAYGATVSISADGVILGSYRDPALRESYQVFSGAGTAMKDLDLSQADIDGYIMSAYSEAARPRGALTGAMNSMLYHLMGMPTSARLEELREMKTVTLADVHALGNALERLNDCGGRSSFGGAAAIQGASDLFDTILYPLGRADAPLTRAQLCALLYPGAADPVDAAKSAGILLGNEAGEALSDHPVTREQLAVILWRMAGMPQPKDAAGTDAAPWAQAAVAWCLENGKLSRMEDGSFQPLGTVTADDVDPQ